MCNVLLMLAGVDAAPTTPQALDRLGSRGRSLLVRGGLLALVATLSVVNEPAPASPVALGLLLTLGALASFRPPPTSIGWLGVSAEVIVCCAAIAPTGGSRSPLLPYLLAPALATGLVAGSRAAVLTSGLAAATLVMLRPTGLSATDSLGEYTAATAQWIVLGLAAGLVAAWVRQILAVAEHDSRYVQANRLLVELRTVTRSLPGTLDTVSTTSAVLDQLRACVHFDRANVLLHGQGRHLVPVAVRGLERSAWATTLDGSGPVARAWSTGAPVVHEDSVALPWHADGKVIGVVVLSRDESPFLDEELTAAADVMQSSSLRLSSAVLFDEIRGLATVDERRRLGREIHDGIAQELVYLGYELDAALEALPGNPAAARETLTRLRETNTRTLGELRLSVYELRSEVDGDRGLTSALSDHVRRLGNSTDLTVHLTLAESGGRLSFATESEVLRIAQEALSNARRHSGARNLWVELIVDPPLVSLRVEDDGTGIDPSAELGFGLAIMRERSERLGAEFMVRPRQPSGTSVALLLRGR